MRKIPTHELTYDRLSEMILFGHLAPGQAVTIQGLVAELDVGMTPVREAIRRLTAEGALVPQGNRRVSLPRLTVPTLDQLAFARLSLEPEIARRAVAGLTADRIAVLDAADCAIDAAIAAGDVAGYLHGNHRFHFTLYEAAEAEVLLALVRTLWLRFGPSLRVVCARYGAGDLPDRHRESLAAMRASDAAALAAAIRADIEQGMAEMRAALLAGDLAT
jgi:DNA-binding GntR family transcriptional regulator